MLPEHVALVVLVEQELCDPATRIGAEGGVLDALVAHSSRARLPLRSYLVPFGLLRDPDQLLCAILAAAAALLLLLILHVLVCIRLQHNLHKPATRHDCPILRLGHGEHIVLDFGHGVEGGLPQYEFDDACSDLGGWDFVGFVVAGAGLERLGSCNTCGALRVTLLFLGLCHRALLLEVVSVTAAATGILTVVDEHGATVVTLNFRVLEDPPVFLLASTRSPGTFMLDRLLACLGQRDAAGTARRSSSARRAACATGSGWATERCASVNGGETTVLLVQQVLLVDVVGSGTATGRRRGVAAIERLHARDALVCSLAEILGKVEQVGGLV